MDGYRAGSGRIAWETSQSTTTYPTDSELLIRVRELPSLKDEQVQLVVSSCVLQEHECASRGVSID